MRRLTRTLLAYSSMGSPESTFSQARPTHPIRRRRPRRLQTSWTRPRCHRRTLSRSRIRSQPYSHAVAPSMDLTDRETRLQPKMPRHVDCLDYHCKMVTNSAYRITPQRIPQRGHQTTGCRLWPRLGSATENHKRLTPLFAPPLQRLVSRGAVVTYPPYMDLTHLTVSLILTKS